MLSYDIGVFGYNGFKKLKQLKKCLSKKEKHTTHLKTMKK